MLNINKNYLRTKIFSIHSDSKPTNVAQDPRNLFNKLVLDCNTGAITRDMAELLLSALEAEKNTSNFNSANSNSETKGANFVDRIERSSLSSDSKGKLQTLYKEWSAQKENFRPSLFCLSTTKSYMAAIDLLKLVVDGKLNQKVSRYGTSFSGGLKVYSATYKPVYSPTDKLEDEASDGYLDKIMNNILLEQKSVSSSGKKLDYAKYIQHAKYIKDILKLRASEPKFILQRLIDQQAAPLHYIIENVIDISKRGDTYLVSGLNPKEVKDMKYEFVRRLLSALLLDIQQNKHLLFKKDSEGSLFIHDYKCLDNIVKIALADDQEESDSYTKQLDTPLNDDMLKKLRTECRDDEEICSLVDQIVRTYCSQMSTPLEVQTDIPINE